MELAEMDDMQASPCTTKRGLSRETRPWWLDALRRANPNPRPRRLRHRVFRVGCWVLAFLLPYGFAVFSDTSENCAVAISPFTCEQTPKPTKATSPRFPSVILLTSAQLLPSADS